MKHFDLFSGYGGFSIACERNGIETIGFSEIDKYASAVLKYHYPNITNYGDITKIDWQQVPDFDLLTGGSPCQDFSIAGKRRGLAGSRSSLAWEFIRGLRDKKPKYFIWENVKGVMSSRGGWDFGNILTAFSESGYSLWWQVLNAKDFGVPQNRERIFVVGFRDGSPREVFFEPRNSKENIKSTGQEISYTIDANYAKGTNTVEKSRRQVVRTNQSGLQQIRKLSDNTDSRGGADTYRK
jgi:DNA (cytosine-5)-methyltransferase 1